MRSGVVPSLLGISLALGACIAPGSSSWSKPRRAPNSTDSGASASKAADPPSCQWPHGAKAAVSLTYDDALASQLEYAVPALDRAGLKATFFLSGANISAFASLASSGHELGSHTLHHPCNAELAALDAAAMAEELDAGDAAVKALGVTGKLGFAYPCGKQQMKAGESYIPLVQQRFRAARGVVGVVADPAHVDLFRVPALFPPSSSDGSDALELIARAEASHGWAVIGVHGVTEAGEYLQLSAAAHDKILGYLKAHADSVWTAPFGSVADAVLACRGGAQTTGK